MKTIEAERVLGNLFLMFYHISSCCILDDLLKKKKRMSSIVEINKFSDLIKKNHIPNFFNTPLGKIKRIDLDQLNSKDYDSRMLNIAKFIVSLFELQKEIRYDFGVMNVLDKRQQHICLHLFGYRFIPILATEYSHLFYVANEFPLKLSKHLKPKLDQALHDKLALSNCDLKEIYTQAWLRVKIVTHELFTPMADIFYPNHAFEALCEGFLKRKTQLNDFSLPMSLNQKQADLLFDIVKDKKLMGDFHLKFSKEVSEETYSKFDQLLQENQNKLLIDNSKI